MELDEWGWTLCENTNRLQMALFLLVLALYIVDLVVSGNVQYLVKSLKTCLVIVFLTWIFLLEFGYYYLNFSILLPNLENNTMQYIYFARVHKIMCCENSKNNKYNSEYKNNKNSFTHTYKYKLYWYNIYTYEHSHDKRSLHSLYIRRFFLVTILCIVYWNI